MAIGLTKTILRSLRWLRLREKSERSRCRWQAKSSLRMQGYSPNILRFQRYATGQIRAARMLTSNMSRFMNLN